jgi:hypothetical protein
LEELDGNQLGVDPALLRYLDALEIATAHPEVGAPSLLVVIDGVVIRGRYTSATDMRQDPDEIPTAFREIAEASEGEHRLCPPVVSLHDALIISGATHINVVGTIRVRLDRISAWSPDSGTAPGASYSVELGD